MGVKCQLSLCDCGHIRDSPHAGSSYKNRPRSITYADHVLAKICSWVTKSAPKNRLEE